MSPDSLAPARVAGLSADWVQCGFLYCMTAEGTGVRVFYRDGAQHGNPRLYPEVGFAVARASADDDLCVQGARGEVYCEVGIAPRAAKPCPGQRLFAVTAIDGPR